MDIEDKLAETNECRAQPAPDWPDGPDREPPAQPASVPDEAVAHFVERVASIISGAPFPSGRSLFKARQVADLAMQTFGTAQPASVAELQLTQSERESLNCLGAALKHKPHAEAVDRALVICDHYARRAQLTICHEKLHERMLAESQPAKDR